MVLLGKIMILQGVGHQISCLGVCFANDPKKGGYTPPVLALDLTTSLRGDFPPFPPPYFPLEAFASAPPPPPHSLVANQNHVFLAFFSPQIPHFSINHPKFPTLFTHFS